MRFNVARVLANNEDLIVSQMRINGETVDELRTALARTEAEKNKLASLCRDYHRQRMGHLVRPVLNDGALALLRVELLSWLRHEADEIVLEIDDAPVLLADDTDAGVRKVSAFYVSLISGEAPTLDCLAMVLRRRCRKVDGTGCGHVDCSCGKEPDPLDVPTRIVELMKESQK